MVHLQTEIEGEQIQRKQDASERSVLEKLRQQFGDAAGACRLKRTLAPVTPQLELISELLDALITLW